MSLINGMLADLEARRAGVRVTEDLVLGDLAAANGVPLRAPARRGAGAATGSLLLGVALTVGALHLGGFLGPSTVPGFASPPTPAVVRPEPVTVLPVPAQPEVVDATPAAARVADAGHAGIDPAEIAAAQEHVDSEARRLAAQEPSPAVADAPAPVVAAPQAVSGSTADPDAGEAPPPAGTLNIRRVEGPAAAPDLQAATRIARAGRHDEALPMIRAILAQTPDSADAHLALVATLAAAGRADEMKVALTEAAARLPGEPGVAMPYARMLVDEGHEAGALAALEAALPAAGEDAEFQAFAAALAQRLERHPQAAQLYRAALALRADNGVWWMGLGISLAAAGESDGARDAFRRALADPGLAPNLRGFVAERLARVSGDQG